jgi:tetratricopeptide (TPR) repeat protein
VIRRAAAVAVIVLAGGCASAPVQTTQSCADADRALRAALSHLTAIQAMPDGCATTSWTRECQQQRDAIRRLAITCSTHAPTLLANALLSYDDREFQRAQEYLDTLFTLRTVQPDGAALRARIALDDGDVPFALRFTEEQIALSPDHGGLREVRAAALFAANRLTDASSELAIAARLGAPVWRVAYDRGLIAEALHQPVDAMQQYRAALTAKPGWPPAATRLRGLEAQGD